jgi:hypothetical protein
MLTRPRPNLNNLWKLESDPISWLSRKAFTPADPSPRDSMSVFRVATILLRQILFGQLVRIRRLREPA